MSKEPLAPSLRRQETGTAKWSYKYLVANAQGITPFNFLDCAHRFALATHGTLWDIGDVTGYTARSISTKAGRKPIEVD